MIIVQGWIPPRMEGEYSWKGEDEVMEDAENENKKRTTNEKTKIEPYL